MKQTRVQKNLALAESIKDRDDARADFAQNYGSATPEEVKHDCAMSIAQSALPGLCWKPVFK